MCIRDRSWTGFTTAAPGTPSVTEGQSLDFRVSGADGDSATLTITNLSDGSTVLDTTTGVVQAAPCSGTPALGTSCGGGPIYAGEFEGGKFMITPGGCSDSSTPTCSSTNDSTLKTWGSNIVDVAGVPNTLFATDKTIRTGRINGPIIAATGSNLAANFCEDMTYGGYTDWYLPNKSELAYIYCHADVGSHNSSYPQEDPNCTTYGGKTSELKNFVGEAYWSSGESQSGTSETAWQSSFSTGIQQELINTRNDPQYVRCVRSYDDVTPVNLDWANFEGQSGPQLSLIHI